VILVMKYVTSKYEIEQANLWIDLIQETVKSTLGTSIKCMAISIITDMIDLGLLDFEITSQFIHSIKIDQTEEVKRELMRLESKVYTIFSHIDSNISIDWLNPDSH
jgi:hypothetical protein